jgi:hypothetical protein
MNKYHIRIRLVIFLCMAFSIFAQDVNAGFSEEALIVKNLVLKNNKSLQNSKNIRFKVIILGDFDFEVLDSALWAKGNIFEGFDVSFEVKRMNCKIDTILNSYVLVFDGDKYLGEARSNSGWKLVKKYQLFSSMQAISIGACSSDYVFCRLGGNTGQLNYLFHGDIDGQFKILVRGTSYEEFLLVEYVQCCWNQFKANLCRLESTGG